MLYIEIVDIVLVTVALEVSIKKNNTRNVCILIRLLLIVPHFIR